MLKSMIKTPENKDIDYPCLMEAVQDNTVVLFSAANTGTVIFSDDEEFTVGHWSDSWSNNSFIKTDKTVVLSS